MKKTLCFVLIIFLIGTYSLAVCAESFNAGSHHITELRVGGGGNSGGGGGSGGSGGGSSGGHSSGHRPHSSNSNAESSTLEKVIHIILAPSGFIIFAYLSVIVFRYKLSRRARKARKIIKAITKGDSSWKFKNVISNVDQGFCVIQNAWAERDMSLASEFVTEQFSQSLQTQLNWMKYKNQKNILKKIKLLSALPVAVHDDPNDENDHIWFYIKGKMIDYVIDTETMKKLSGSTSPAKFEEYWQYVRKDDKWLLNKILQIDEEDQIAFSE